MSDAAANDGKKDGKGKKEKRRRSQTFPEMLDSKKFSVPDEAFKLYRGLQNPFAVYLQQYRAAGITEITIERLINLVNQNVGYYKRKLECLKLLADFSHAKPKSGAPILPPEPPPAKGAPPQDANPYANMTTDQLIAGLPVTDENFDAGSSAPGS